MIKVTVSDLRDNLGEWIERVRGGDEVIITDNDVPVARMAGMTLESKLAQLERDGIIGPCKTDKRPLARLPRVRAASGKPLSDIVTEQRR